MINYYKSVILYIDTLNITLVITYYINKPENGLHAVWLRVESSRQQTVPLGHFQNFIFWESRRERKNIFPKAGGAMLVERRATTNHAGFSSILFLFQSRGLC